MVGIEKCPEFSSRFGIERYVWNGLAVDPNQPAVLVRKLESSEPGCRF